MEIVSSGDQLEYICNKDYEKTKTLNALEQARRLGQIEKNHIKCEV